MKSPEKLVPEEVSVVKRFLRKKWPETIPDILSVFRLLDDLTGGPHHPLFTDYILGSGAPRARRGSMIWQCCQMRVGWRGLEVIDTSAQLKSRRHTPDTSSPEKNTTVLRIGEERGYSTTEE